MNIRLKILKKIAQVTQPTSEQTVAVAGSPVEVEVSSFPSVIKAWEQGNVTYIQKIIDVFNMSIYVLTHGKTDFYKLKQSNFTFDISSYGEPTKSILRLAQLFYKTVLTDNGVNFKDTLLPEQKETKVNNLKQSALFGNIPDGGINSVLPTKIGGNFKSLIINSLNNIK